MRRHATEGLVLSLAFSILLLCVSMFLFTLRKYL